MFTEPSLAPKHIAVRRSSGGPAVPACRVTWFVVSSSLLVAACSGASSSGLVSGAGDDSAAPESGPPTPEPTDAGISARDGRARLDASTAGPRRDAGRPDTGAGPTRPDAAAVDAGVEDAPGEASLDATADTSWPPLLAPLPRDQWTASAFDAVAAADRNAALDGDDTTRWTADLGQAVGQWFELDMAATRSFTQLTIDAGFQLPNDYVGGFEVSVSNDGLTWGVPVAVGLGSSQIVTVSLPPQSARFIRIVVTVPSTRWWGISEFNVWN